jgi:1-acyl-sn-glycerol-3-phosphate acyltransferase
MAKEQLFRFKPLGYFLRNYGAFPVRRGQLDRQALRQAEQVLADGQVLAIFPEGMRSRSHRLQQAFTGVALIALRSGAPILPVGFTGTEQINRPTWFLSRPEVKIVIGRAFHLLPLDGRVTRADLDKLTDYMMQHIAALLPLSYRGVYAAEEDEIGH